ncbi:homoserine kinase [Kushneria indalinina]|uniref:Homoserine kinase n=1 Tax=Kushneria indalinina DSM 14324 TaxID=1122140 RepID=A0A3D9DVE0_9GAMM|nr:homoserine kinase [Kushneria indalinina]REC94750.1 homoserine kinase [Kushneria indalinina DSM 14324]
MAVFTPLSDEQVAHFLERYDVGTLLSVEGVTGGTENSTFFVTTDREVLVLTLFEQGEQEELPFFVDLLAWLDQHQLPVPGPLFDRNGVALQRLADRPALLFPRLAGRHPEQPGPAQCAAIGQVLGQIHRISQGFQGSRPNPRDLRWVHAVHSRVMSYLGRDDQILMRDCIDALDCRLRKVVLPQGALHGDLFRDNTLYEGDRLCGVIDFYNGCTGDLLFDLAIVINDWCSDSEGALIPERYDAIIEAYAAERPFTDEERRVWPTMLELTALRYWLSRLLVVYVDPPAHALTPKDPTQYRQILKARVDHPPAPLP